MINNNQDSLMTDLENDLNKKTFEELIYIYYNQEHYVSNFTQNGRLKNQELLLEVKKLNEEYENIIINSNLFKLYNYVKIFIDIFSIDSIVQELKCNNDNHNSFF